MSGAHPHNYALCLWVYIYNRGFTEKLGALLSLGKVPNEKIEMWTKDLETNYFPYLDELREIRRLVGRAFGGTGRLTATYEVQHQSRVAGWPGAAGTFWTNSWEMLPAGYKEMKLVGLFVCFCTSPESLGNKHTRTKHSRWEEGGWWGSNVEVQRTQIWQKDLCRGEVRVCIKS